MTDRFVNPPRRVEKIGLEPTTPCLQGRCSSQLSYIPIYPDCHNSIVTPTNTRNNIPSERSGTGDKDTVRLRFVNLPGINDCTFLFIPFCNPQ